MSSFIPKVIIQTSRAKPEPYVVEMIRHYAPGWEYKHFNDAEVIQFFQENYLDEFPDVIQKFYSFNYGSHRADLFRYYYLYVKGGVYMDTDAMLETNLDNVVDDCAFFSVESTYFPGTIFQGFLGCEPRNIVMFEALRNIYYIENQVLLNNFHLLCKNLHGIAEAYQDLTKIKLFLEIYGNETDAFVIDKETRQLVLIHYHIHKIIPDKRHCQTCPAPAPSPSSASETGIVEL